MTTTIRLYHDRYVALDPVDDVDALDDDAKAALIPVATVDGTDYRRRRIAKATPATASKPEVGTYTELSLPPGYGDSQLELAHLVQALTERHAEPDDVPALAMFPGGDAKLARRLAGALDAELVEWPEDSPPGPPTVTGPPAKGRARAPKRPPSATLLVVYGLVLWALTRWQLRTNVGRDFTSDAMFRALGSRPTEAQVIALAQAGAAPAATQTLMGGAAGNELTADGFGRAVAAYAHTAGTQTSTLQKTFTHTAAAGAGTARTINLVAVFAQAFGVALPGAVDTGIMAFIMAQPSPPTLTGGDSLNQTITFDFGT